MAETLTYDPGTDTVSSENNLTPDEQDSLQVGEKMVEEQAELLAGKYKNAEDLESAYLELQKKLGDKDGVQEEGRNEAQEVEEESTASDDDKRRKNTYNSLSATPHRSRLPRPRRRRVRPPTFPLPS